MIPERTSRKRPDSPRDRGLHYCKLPGTVTHANRFAHAANVSHRSTKISPRTPHLHPGPSLLSHAMHVTSEYLSGTAPESG